MKWRSSLLRDHLPFVRIVFWLSSSKSAQQTKTTHGFQLFIIVNLKPNCWNSGIVREFRCQNHSSFLFNGFPQKIRAHRWNGFEWNSNVMSCMHRQHEYTLFFNAVCVFAAQFPFIIRPMNTVSRWIHPDSGSWFQWLLLLLNELMRSNVTHF